MFDKAATSNRYSRFIGLESKTYFVNNLDAVTAVRSAGKCEASYAIVAAETIESGRFITTEKLVQASAKQIVDCSQTSGNHGCKGGDIVSSYDYILKKGITDESLYPWKEAESPCKYELGLKQWEILGCVKVKTDNEISIKAAIKHQPIAAHISLSKLKNYKNGVYTEDITTLKKCDTTGDHWMTMIGYGV